VDRKDLLIALKFLVDPASTQSVNSAVDQIIAKLSQLGQGDALRGLQQLGVSTLNTSKSLMVLGDSAPTLSNIAQFFERIATAEGDAAIQANVLLQAFNQMYALQGASNPAKQLIGGYPALPSGTETSAESVINLGAGAEQASQSVINLGSGVQLLNAGLQQTGPVIDVVARDIATADDAFAKFSETVRARGEIIIQIMEQTKMSYDEANAAAKSMSVVSPISGKTGAMPTSTAIEDSQVRAYVKLRTAVTGADTAEQDFDVTQRQVTEDMVSNSMSIDDYNKNQGVFNGKVDEGTRKFRSFGMAFAGFELRFAGTQLTRFGTNLLSSIDVYVKYAGIAEQTSADWLASQDSVAIATRSIGQSLAEVALPAMQEMARVATFIADIFRKYPALGTTTVAVGGIAIILGNIATFVGTIMTGLAAFRFIAPAAFAAASGAIAGATIGGVSITAIVAAALPIILVTVLAAGVIAAIWYAVTHWTGQAGKDLAKTPGQLATVAAYGVGYAVGGQEKANEWALSIAKLTGAIEELDQTVKPTAQDVDAYISYLQAVKDAETKYQADRLDIITTYNKQVADSNKTFTSNMEKIAKQIRDIQNSQTQDDINNARTQQQNARDFAKSESQASKTYYNERMKAARDYGIEVQRMEEDHQRKMLQMQQDHDLKIQDLLFNNDAFGILAEKRSYEKSRSQEETNYAVEARRKSEDFARRLSDMEAQFASERANRIADYAQQLADQQQAIADRKAQQIANLKQQQADLEQQHKDDLARLASEERDKLIALDKAHNDELVRLQNDFNDKLRQLDANLLNERTLRAAYYDAMSKDLQAWLTNMKGQFSSNLPNYPTRAGGGYMFNGLYRTGEQGDEFALSNPTTRIMERAVGGRLTQENIVTALAGGKSAVINQNFRFSGDMSADQKRWYRQVAHAEALDAFAEAFGG